MIKKSTFIFFVILLITIMSCDKEDFAFDLPKVIKLPTLITYDISNITLNSASCDSEITFDGGAPVMASGVCYATTSNPTTTNFTVNAGSSGGYFYSLINELSPNTTYYVRAFASNSAGTGYGNQMVFKTLSTIATITTAPVTNITAFAATSGGNVITDGGAPVNLRGVCYSTYSNPTVSNNYVVSGSGSGSFTTNITNLLPNTTYYVRAFAQNEIGMSYGSQYSFTTSSALAIVTTSTITNITASSATIGGDITSDAGSAITNRGVCYATTSNPTISNSYVLSGTGMGSFTSNLTGLLQNTTYYVRAFAINSYGIAYGTQSSFKTYAEIASLTTTSITNITASSATSGGNITSDGGTTITNRGVCYATTSNPTTSNNFVLSGTGIGSFTSNLSGLVPNTTYYVRAFAINAMGTAYGSQYSFKTSGLLANVATTNLIMVSSTVIYATGNISSDGGSNLTNRGFCYATTTNPTTSNSIVNSNSGTGSFESYITGLKPNTNYYVRAYAINATGTAYGSQMSITTDLGLPTITTTSISYGRTTAIIGGNVTSDGGSAITYRGVVYATTNNPTTSNNIVLSGTGIGAFTSNLSGLSPNTTYYIRVFAINSYGVVYGSQSSFKTSP